MDTNSHIVRRSDAYYAGWSEERANWFLKHGTRIYHPDYDPRPIKKKTSAWGTALAWALTALGLAAS